MIRRVRSPNHPVESTGLTDDTRDRLIQLLSERARVSREADARFTLASGEVSSFYFDGKRVTQSCEGLPLVGKVVWDFARATGAEAVGGLAAGSIPISDAAVAYAAFTGQQPLQGFYVLAEEKAHGTRERLYHAFTDSGEAFLSKGTNVLIVDDVMTTGRSMMQAIEEVERRGATVRGVLVLIDRRNTAAATANKIRADYRFMAVAQSDDEGELTPFRGDLASVVSA